MEYNVKDIIEYSIKIEKESYAFYVNATKKMDNQGVKSLLILLSNEEIHHQNNLRSLIDQEKITKAELDATFELDSTLFEKIINSTEIATDSSPLEILKIALDREINTENFYAMLSTLSNISEDVIEIFGNLRLQEKGHVNKIQVRIDKLLE